MNLCQCQFFCLWIGRKNSEIGDHCLWSGAGNTEPTPFIAAVQKSRAGNKFDLLNERTARLAQYDQNLLGGGCDLRCAARTGQANLWPIISPDHSGVNVSKLVHLGRTEKPHIDPTALQPVRKDFRGRHNGRGSLCKFTVADRERKNIRLSIDRARLIDQDKIWRMCQSSEICRYAWQPNAHKADLTLFQIS